MSFPFIEVAKVGEIHGMARWIIYIRTTNSNHGICKTRFHQYKSS